MVCALRENLSNRSSGVQIPRDICTSFGRHLYSTKCSWIVKICKQGPNVTKKGAPDPGEGSDQQ